jgi:ABC-type sugar transport system ATPase subunit
MRAEPAVELRRIGKRFGGLVALDDVNLTIHRGEIVALVGDNGAGKSTLTKVVAGVHRPDSGAVVIDGIEADLHRPQDARDLGVEVVYQDLALAPNLDVVSNLFLGREVVRLPGLGWLDRRRMRTDAVRLLESLDVRIPSYSTKVETLSGGQRQAIAIARASHWGRLLLIMDEPTAALGVRETAKVEALVHRLRETGLAVLLVSHNLDQVFRLADRVAVMRRGRLVAERVVSETHGDDVVALITGAR